MAQVNIKQTEILSDERYTLKKITYELQKKDGTWEEQSRQVFDHGNAAAVLLYNAEKGTVILIKQFRLATYVNGNESGMLLECCAGLVDKDEAPADTIIREIEEETGFKVERVKQVLEAYSSAGSLTEKLYLFTAEYSREQRTGGGGGLEEEGEDIQVLEIPFSEALRRMETGAIKDAKTIMLLQYAQLHQLMPV